MVKSKVKNQSKDAAIKAKDGRLIETQEGGPGSGCSGDNCGRKPSGKSEKTPKGKMFGSDSSIDGIKKGIEKFFYSKPGDISLVQTSDKTWDVHNSKGKIDGVHVRQQGSRFRFEDLTRKESQQESGTFGPSAYLNQVFSKVKPKRFEASKPKETAPEKPSVDVEQLVTELLNNNPTMNSSTFLNLLKSQGIKFSKEADSGSGLGALVRGKESAISFRSVKFLEKDMGPSATDVGIQKPKDKYLGFTKFRAVMLQEGLGNFGDSYFYSAEALNSAAPVFEGKKIFADHPSSLDEQTRPERSVRDVLGHFENVHVEKMDDGRSQLVGDVVILPDDSFAWARSLMAHAVEFHEKFPDKDFIGLSINASGDANPTNLAEFMKNDLPESIKIKLNEAIGRGITEIKIVSKISEAVSCDLVTEAGAGGGVKNYIESRGGEMKDEQQEGGPGSGRYPKGSGGGKSDKTNSQTKSKAIVKKDKISSMHDIMKKQNLDSEYASPNTVADIAAKNGIKLTSDEVVRISDTYEHKPKKQGENMENEMQQADGIEQHPDAAQDVELIKSMLKKAFGGEEDPSQEECTIAKEAMEAFGEMGHEKDKAGELAMEFMKASKHLAQKQAQKQSEADAELKDEEQDVEESEEEIVDEEAPVKEAAKLNDEIIKLKGELARYKENDKKLSIANHIEKICKESKRSNAYTSEFKSVVKEAKSIEEVDKAWRLFEAGRKASGSSMIESAFEGIQTFATEKIVTGTDGQTTSLNFDDCKVY